MRNNPREIRLYYNSESSSDRKTIAHAQGLSRHVSSYTHENSRQSTTNWKLILDALEAHPKDLMNKAHPYYQKNIRGKDFNTEDWINVLKYHPDLIKAPIAVKGNRAVLCNNPTDIYQL